MWIRSVPAVLFGVVFLTAGYSAANKGPAAQTPAVDVPLAAGDNVTLHYPQIVDKVPASTVTCAVVAVRGSFVRCQPSGNPNFHDPGGERWRNLTFVADIVKHPNR